MPLPPVEPPLINSSNPWATTTADLQALFDCPHTGAVTTRTSLLTGFDHQEAVHQYTFFDPQTHALPPNPAKDERVPVRYGGSLNTLGYSPINLTTYLGMIRQVVANSTLPDERRRTKPFIVSVTGSAQDVAACYAEISRAQELMENPLCVEINLSCPNIPDKPPPAYEAAALGQYLRAVAAVQTPQGGRRVPVGIKTPPYTYADQFRSLIGALRECSTPTCPIDFVTAVNTLGSSLLLSDDGDAGAGGKAAQQPALNSASGAGIGGLAGTPLHPLALGNVKTIRGMLDACEELKGVDVIGIGGVSDAAGFRRMKAVGARVAGVGTALGREGVGVFGRIMDGSREK